MADRPILFSGPMVRAIAEGRKTQTRRVLRPQPYPLEDRSGYWNASGAVGGRIVSSDADLALLHRYAVGDRLWVREAWHAARSLDATRPCDIPRDADIEHACKARSYEEIGLKGKLRPGMFMPRWASRLTLTVTDVRVERLQDISTADATAEGIERLRDMNDPTKMSRPEFGIECVCAGVTARDAYASLWDGLNAKRGFGWDTNPWVVAVTFGIERRNIDAAAVGEEAA